MGVKDDLAAELESTRQEFHRLVESVPEEFYGHSSANPAWTIGDVLYHITLGPAAIRAEIWMIRHVSWLFSAFLNKTTSRIFNWGNALFARHPNRKMVFTDNIMPHAYWKTLLPRLAAEIPGLWGMYEQKANPTLKQVSLLADSGIRAIQPGIEALSSGLLKP